MIDVRNLSKTFRVPKKAPGLRGSLKGLFRREWVEKRAVVDVSFSVGEGEIVGLIGENGAGKTTLVKMMAGIVHPTSGTVRVLGTDPWDREDSFRRRIALVMGQKAQLWWDLPAADGFLLLKEIYRLDEAEYRESLAELTRILGVEKDLHVQVRRLSLGERMKMELVAALLHRPKVVFLDEPTIGLDVTAQRAVREFVLAYRERRRPATILTSHYMDDIERLCARVVILKAGAVVYDGPLSQVVARYADHKVVTVHLEKGSVPAARAGGTDDLGETIESSDGLWKVRVPRAKTAAVASEILRRFDVLDLTIEEPDVSTIVEKIFRERGGTAR
jgi:ABC-2 type transport system ATP-binding protein